MTMFFKKMFFIFLIAIFFIFEVNAMPPHPNNKNPAGRERTTNLDSRQEPLYKSMMRSSPSRAPSGVPKEMNLLVILADFGGADEGDPLSFQPQSLISLYKNILGANDATSPISLTMKQYWLDMSNNKLTLNIDVVGTVTASKGWQYYGKNNTSGYDSYPAQFVSEAVRLAYSTSLITDFSKYDNDDDGYVDSVIIIHAGPGEEIKSNPEDAIWSHSWDLYSAKFSGDGDGVVTLGNKKINHYTIQPEFNKSHGDSTIGVFCHEFAHVLGLPDLYDTSEETNGVGSWSLMAAGSWGSGTGVDPAPLLAWERYEIGGNAWVTINSLSKATQPINIKDIEEDRTAYKIPLSTTENSNFGPISGYIIPILLLIFLLIQILLKNRKLYILFNAYLLIILSCSDIMDKLIDKGSTSQYLILEKKSFNSGPGKKYVPATGILITHIDEGIIGKYMSSNTVNNGKNRVHGVNIVEADGTTNGGKGSLWNTSNTLDYENSVFPATTGKNKINRSTTGDDIFPNSNYYLNEKVTSKTGYSGIEITVTSASAVTITVTP